MNAIDVIKELLADGSDDPKKAAQLRNAILRYIQAAESREADFKAREEQYLGMILSLTNEGRELKEFFSIIAHDLRRSIGNINEMAKILVGESQTVTAEESEKIRTMLSKSAGNTYELLLGLLEWSKSGMTVNLENVSLRQIAERVRNLYAESAEKKGINIGNEISDNVNLLCDRNMIETVLRNLVSNAIKFCSKDDDIIIRAIEIGNIIEISVIDTGIGMNSEMVEKLFYLGYDSGRSGTANEKSSGIGLRLCKKFVELHKGKIFVESIEGFGSNFYFTIPKNPADAIDIHGTQNQVIVATN